MRKVITRSVPALAPPTQEDRRLADAGPSTAEENARWMQAWEAMNALEVVQPPGTAPDAGPAISVAAWNLERCKHVEASAEVLAARNADVVLATEIDWGCARSGQRHTTRELAALLGHGYAFATEFVELALGDARETESHAGETNLHGLHGNAVLSRFPIGRTATLPLDDGGLWYVNDLKQGQRRIGGRNAVAAEVLAPQGSFFAVAAHFESESDPAERAGAAERLLAVLLPLAGDAPIVIGGDFNCFELSRQGLDHETMMERPEIAEPFFAVMRRAGFAWRETNAAGATTRRHPWQSPDRPLLKIDWLFARGFAGSEPWIAPALSPDGIVLSDHEPIGASLIAPPAVA
jgi:endonuclease/exonuclease/phosphatase family metal-dependent hydrolase